MSKQNAAAVSTHRDVHSTTIIDSGGHKFKQWTILATVEGYQQAIAEAVEFGDVVWVIEGTDSYGRGFANSLPKATATVYEVPGSLTKRHRRQSSRKSKSDQHDAQAIAEVVLREGDRPPRVEQLDEQEAIRLVYDRF